MRKPLIIVKNFKDKHFDELLPEDIDLNIFDSIHYYNKSIKKLPKEWGFFEIGIETIHIIVVCKTKASCVAGYEILNCSPKFDKPQLIGLVYDFALAKKMAETACSYIIGNEMPNQNEVK